MKKTKYLIFLSCTLFFCSTLFGQITFEKTYGGASGSGTAIQQTNDSGFIITGMTSDFGQGYHDVYLMKTSYDGSLQWTKTYGESYPDRGYSIRQTNDNGFIIAGTTYSFGAGNSDIYLVKTTSDGTLQWSKTYGGTGYDEGNDVLQISDGSYVIAGSAGGAVLIKTDVNGDTLWCRTYTRTPGMAAQSLLQTNDGGFVIVGGGSAGVISLIKTDSVGNILWTSNVGGYNAGSIKSTIDGGYIIVGTIYGASGDIYLAKTDSNGILQWSKSYGAGGMYGDYGNSVIQTFDGSYILVGKVCQVQIPPEDDLCLIKTNSVGDTLWTKIYGNTSIGEQAVEIIQTPDGGFAIVGYGQGVYFIKTDSSGNGGCYESSFTMNVSSITTSITPYPVSQISSIIFIGNPLTLTDSGGTENVLCSSVGIEGIIKGNSLLISPNPSVGNFIISFEKTITMGNVEILNILGEIILKENISNESNKEINLKNVSAGIYFVKVFDGEKQFTKKIIIEQGR